MVFLKIWESSEKENQEIRTGQIVYFVNCTRIPKKDALFVLLLFFRFL